MSDVRITIFVADRVAGQIESSLENFDAAKHIIPKRILNKIRNSQSDLVELFFTIGQVGENSKPVQKLNAEKLIMWMYENGYFSLTSADMLTLEIEKGTFNI